MKKSLAIILVTLLTGCTSTQEVDIYAQEQVATAAPIMIKERVKHVIEFGLDSARLPYDAAEVVEPHARYLLENIDAVVILQGSASTEGSESYNYQLGLRRAKAVKSLLQEYGVMEDRIKTTSIGEHRGTGWPKRAVTLAY